MKCPHCTVEIYESWKSLLLIVNQDIGWFANSMVCPSCSNIIIRLQSGYYESYEGVGAVLRRCDTDELVYPKYIKRNQCHQDVPAELASDYDEACSVLNISPKSSAALSRRCLQNLLRNYAKVKKDDLFKEIQEVISNNTLPSFLVESIDAIRNIGNFAAHPQKSKSSGEIIDVEPNEAEWTLDVLESLFDFYFVQPKLLKRKRESLNTKLSDIGKPKMI